MNAGFARNQLHGDVRGDRNEGLRGEVAPGRVFVQGHADEAVDGVADWAISMRFTAFATACE